jgi:predicted DNA-binding protein (MmcQ/YjbR family)
MSHLPLARETPSATAPYLSRVKCVQLTDPRALPLADLQDFIEQLHALVPGGLSNKLQKQLLG